MLLVHLAANYLSPNGYVALSGDLNVFDPALSFKQPSMQQIAKSTIQKQAIDLASDREEEEVIWSNVAINMLLNEELISEKDRKSPALYKVFNRK